MHCRIGTGTATRGNLRTQAPVSSTNKGCQVQNVLNSLCRQVTVHRRSVMCRERSFVLQALESHYHLTRPTLSLYSK